MLTRERTATASLFIDQGYALHAGEWNFPDSALRGVYTRNCVYEDVTGWESFEPVLTKAEACEPIDLWRCAECIPPEWYENDRDGLERIVESIVPRRTLIRQLIAAFGTSRRNPFPTRRTTRRFVP